MTRLNKIPVLFDQEQHTYTNTENGTQYKGITGTLIHRLFPDKYKDIPKHIIETAARRGTMIHEEIELIETIGINPTSAEGKAYVALKKEYGLKFLESEYTVSDLEHYATNIDAIYEVSENVVDIVDYKTTYRFDKESVSWQLSICAMFLEKNNPHIKVRNCFGVWLRHDIAQLIEVERRSIGEINALIDADQKDEPYCYSPAFPDYISDNINRLCALNKRIKELTEEYSSIQAEILQKMAENGDKSFDTGDILFTVVAPSVRETFDSKKFKAEHADMFGQYIKKSTTKESLKLTFR